MAIRLLASNTEASADAVLAVGEVGVDTATGLLRIGDGTSAWSGLTPVAPSGASGLSGDAFSTGTPVDLSNNTSLHPFAGWAAYASRQGTLASAGITTPDGIVFDAADSGFYLSILTFHIALTLSNPPDLRLLKADDGFWMSEHQWIGAGGVTQNIRFVAEGWVDAGAGVFTPAASLGDVTDVGEGTISQAWFTVLKLG